MLNCIACKGIIAVCDHLLCISRSIPFGYPAHYILAHPYTLTHMEVKLSPHFGKNKPRVTVCGCFLFQPAVQDAVPTHKHIQTRLNFSLFHK